MEDLLLSIDRKDYAKTGKRCRRIAVRGIIKKENKYAMIHSEKYGEYKFPGGGMKEGETKEDTLKREVREETGLVVKEESIKYIGRAEEIRKGLYDAVFEMTSYYYQCDVEDKLVPRELDDYEREYGYELEFVTLDEAIKNNKNIKETRNIPWIDRDTIIMEKLNNKE